MSSIQAHILNNREFIPNFAKRRRQGETITTAFVESTINQVVSRRFVNEELDEVFHRWYPKFRVQPKTQEPAQRAA